MTKSDAGEQRKMFGAMSEDQAIAIEFTDNFDPATGEVFARLPEAASSDVDSAVEVAAAVKSIWASLG